MDHTLPLHTPTPTPPDVRRARPHCYDCNWIDVQIDATGDPAYLDLLIDHVNATHARPLR